MGQRAGQVNGRRWKAEIRPRCIKLPAGPCPPLRPEQRDHKRLLQKQTRASPLPGPGYQLYVAYATKGCRRRNGPQGWGFRGRMTSFMQTGRSEVRSPNRRLPPCAASDRRIAARTRGFRRRRPRFRSSGFGFPSDYRLRTSHFTARVPPRAARPCASERPLRRWRMAVLARTEERGSRAAGRSGAGR